MAWVSFCTGIVASIGIIFGIAHVYEKGYLRGHQDAEQGKWWDAIPVKKRRREN
jgi:hypothetical protein